MSKHFALKYIGLPWKAGAVGPKSFNCWGLIVYINKKYFGRNITNIEIDDSNLTQIFKTFKNHKERHNWTMVKIPKEGDSVLLTQSKHPMHVGIWLDIDKGGVLHCIENHGVVFQNKISLNFNRWSIEGFYRYYGKNCNL